MDAAFAEHLERVRAHRAELGDAMGALEEALALPVGLGAVWRRRVRAALTELAHDLRDHVELTEAPDGLYADLRAHAPHLASRVETQLRDHVDLLAAVEQLLEDRDAGVENEEDVVAHREAATMLLDRLVRHRQRGSDLVYAAYAVDLGGSG